jgi:hypothetical protein
MIWRKPNYLNEQQKKAEEMGLKRDVLRKLEK